MTTRIKFIDGSGGKLISRYAVYPYRAKYLKMDCVIYDNDERIAIPYKNTCDTCRRDFSKIRHKTRYLCTELSINKQLGYVARICIDCQWFYEQRKGFKPPGTIAQFLASGFSPYLL